MIISQEEINKWFEWLDKDFNLEINELKKKSVIAKNELLSYEQTTILKSNSNIDNSKIILMLIKVLSDLILFQDKEVENKLNQFNLKPMVLRWFIDLDEILKVLDTLKSVKGLNFSRSHYLSAIHSHLIASAMTDLIELYGFQARYNNKDTNIIYKDFKERYRRREYNSANQNTKSMSAFEKDNNVRIDDFEKMVGNELTAKTLLLKPLQGYTIPYLNFLGVFNRERISKRKTYLEFYPLLQLILKQNKNFLTDSDFIAKDYKGYNADIDEYKIRQVKTFFRNIEPFIYETL